MDITDYRRKIDEIDHELVRLLNERARCVVEIGRIKQKDGLPIHEPHREQQVLRNALVANRGPLSSQAVQRVFERIVEEGRSLQRELFEAAEPKSPTDSQQKSKADG
ncbi:MAG: chorismate mutase [Acidobacteria bacterium]|nr:chorismate mutase [Acidobacteriota bacterium]